MDGTGGFETEGVRYQHKAIELSKVEKLINASSCFFDIIIEIINHY